MNTVIIQQINNAHINAGQPVFFIPYKEYLQSGYWKSLSARKKHNSKCGVCGSKEHLNVHHTKYYKNKQSVLFNETSGILKVLCEDCHHLWHEINGDVVYKSKHAGRIKYLMSLGAEKRYAFNNCIKRSYAKAKRELKATGGMVGVAAQISLPTIPDSA